MGMWEYHPPHVYEDNALYFLTGATAHHQRFLDTDRKRALVRDVLQEAVRQSSARLYGWVMLADHYHLLLRTDDATPIHRFISRLHGSSAVKLNELDATPGRKVWYQYWDRLVRGENDFWSYLNYIHVNPIKHGYVRLACKAMTVMGGAIQISGDSAPDIHDSLARYAHSSYAHYLHKYGREFLTDLWMRYPIPASLEGDDF